MTSKNNLDLNFQVNYTIYCNKLKHYKSVKYNNMNQNYAKSFKPDSKFHKISVVGGGLTGAFMTLLLEKSNLFDNKEIAWIKPKVNIENDFRTSFYNNKNIEFLKKLSVLQDIPDKDITSVRQIHVFSKKKTSPLIWESSDKNNQLGAIIKNNTVLNILNKQLLDTVQYNDFVTNTQFNDFERILYLKDKKSIKSHLVLSADGKNSNLRKLSSIKVIIKKNNHMAISGFLRQSKKHNFIAKQVFSKLGPIGILPYKDNDIVNFVLSIEKNKAESILLKKIPEQSICDELNGFFSHLELTFSPIDKIDTITNSLSKWPLELNVVSNPTANRLILVGDSAHSIHPLAGQGFNLSIEDCISSINAIKNSLKFGNDLGDLNILKDYRKDRLPKTLAMTSLTDFLFYGFTSDSDFLQSVLSTGMKVVDKSKFKNIFKYIAGS